MKISSIVTGALAAAAFIFSSSPCVNGASEGKSGEQLFKEHCAACHPGGGNILNPQKTLHKKDRAANNIHTADDIVKKMRNPGPFPTHPQEWAGMKMFDEKTISNDDARKIADYVLRTFE